MTLNRLAVRVSMFWHQQDLIRQQTKLIRLLKDERNQQRLNHAREIQGLVSAWLISLETPEVDMRPELAALDAAMADSIAVLEEHIT